MTPEKLLELLNEAERAHIEFYKECPTMPPATITLTSVRKTEPRGERVRIFGRKGPVGVFLTVKHRLFGCGLDVTARYNVAEVRAYILKEMGRDE